MLVTIQATSLSLFRMSENGTRLKRLVRHRLRSAKRCPVEMPWIVLSVLVAFAGFIAGAAEPGKDLSKPSELFRGTNVWAVHFKFTPKQWEAMEPEQTGGGFFGGRGGPRGFGGPGGPGAFGPAMFVAPTFLKQGDQNGDSKLSKEEFRALGEKWFAEWDKEKSGKLNANQLRTGLNSTLAQPNVGPPGAGGRAPGMNLQGAEG